jgi:carbonic anhydrase
MIMKTALLVGFVSLACCAAFAASTVHWTYSGEDGPANWARLSPEFADCDGENQSPINLTGFVEADLRPIDFAYQPGGSRVLNNGHTVQVDYAEGSSIVVDDIRFDLKQFHFHAPSENLIEGKSFPMEAHFVHADTDGNLAVVSVMFIEGKANDTLAQTWAHMPVHAGDKHALPTPVAADGLLPSNRDYYRFNGSLTTPPCSEGVRWLVMKEQVSVSKQQIQEFSKVMHHPNNRPVQPKNARSVLQ